MIKTISVQLSSAELTAIHNLLLAAYQATPSTNTKVFLGGILKTVGVSRQGIRTYARHHPLVGSK